MEIKCNIGELILQRLDLLLQSFENVKTQTSSHEEWLKNDEVCQLLGITKRTLQKYRDEGKIKFSQFGRKILYRKQHVELFLEKHDNPDFSFPDSQNRFKRTRSSYRM